jgi:hypothetical protein
MTYKETITLCSENYTEQINAVYWQNKFFNVKLSVVHNVIHGELGGCMVLLSEHNTVYQTECNHFELKVCAVL